MAKRVDQLDSHVLYTHDRYYQDTKDYQRYYQDGYRDNIFGTYQNTLAVSTPKRIKMFYSLNLSSRSRHTCIPSAARRYA